MWVTLEQTTVLPRRPSTSTSSSYRGPIHRAVTSNTQDPETVSVSSANKETFNLRAQLPRARFAENPIIGPTGEANCLVSRRKSALKSRSPNEVPPPPSQNDRVDPVPTLTVDKSQTRRSSFTSPNLLLPSQPLSPKRHRTNSMIATTEAPWSDQYLCPEEAAHPEGNRKLAEGFDPFRFRQRVRSMSDYGAPDPLSRKQPDVVACETNPSPLLGYFMEQDAFFREKARQNMGLTSGSEDAETDEDFTSFKFESLDFSDHSRPVSSISSNTSSFSSTLLDDHALSSPGENPNVATFTQRQNLVPPEDEPAEYFSLTPPSTSFPQEKSSNKWISDSSSGLIVSPLERLSSISYRPPSISTRKRSGTVLPPQKPEIIPEDLSGSSSTPLSAQPVLTKLEEKPTRPPARPPRPPRSYLREISNKIVDSSQQVHSRRISHDKVAVELPNGALETSAPLSFYPSITMSVEEESSVYGSARSHPTPLPLHEPSSNQSKPPNNSSPQPQKASSENRTATVKLHTNGARSRLSVTLKASRRNSARVSYTPLRKTTEASANKSGSSKTFDPHVTSTVTDDESDEFESADEGDEEFWSVAQGFDNNPHLVATSIPDASTDQTEESPRKPSLIQSPPSEPVSVGEKKTEQDAQGTHIKASRKVQCAIIGAFPRSESFLESSMSSSLSNFTSFEDSSIEEPLSPIEAFLPISPPEKVDSNRSCQPSSRSKLSPKSPSKRKKPPQIQVPIPRSPPVVEISSAKKALPSTSHGTSDLAHISPVTPSFENKPMPRTCSLEGLAALRSSTCPSPHSHKKKSSARSAGHLRQLSKVINFCTRDGLMDEQLSEEIAVPLPVELAEHPTRLKQLNSPSPVGPLYHPSSPHALSTSSWKNSMALANYEHLKSLYGTLEMRRQEVIWELCKTENSFATGLRQVIEVFASPLRTPEGNWISGVPIPVAKLLDWLEDIVNLHSQIAFQAKNSRDYQTRALGLVVHISEVFLEVAPKLEIYQPYLIRFSEVTALIDEMVSDPDSDFGEFVRMQSVLPECGKMSLNSFLLKPVQRLMKYPLFFKQLCEVTPTDHPDHAATVSLLDTTDSMIRVLQEVKEREDEYEKLKVLQSKVKGLPPGFVLARRDRRLLAQGLLKRVHVSARGRQSIHVASNNPWAMNPQTAPANLAVFPLSPNSNHSSEITTSTHSRISYDGNSSQASLISSLSAGLGGIKSPNRTERENGGMSFVKYSYSPNSSFPGSPNNNNNKQFYDWMVIDKSVEKPNDSSHYVRTRSKSGTWETEVEKRYGSRRNNSTNNNNTNKNSNSIGSNRLSKKPKESPVHVFVFSDVLLLATRHSEGVRLIRTPMVQKKKKDSSSYYSALESVGISRLIAVSDVSGQLEYPHLLKLDILPYGGEVNQFRSPASLLFTFPDRLPGASRLSRYEEVQKERYKWLAAFYQSLRSNDPSSKTTGSGKEEEDLLDPSHPNFQEIPIEVQERHERHWWSNRHRLVSKELELLNEGETSYEPSDLDTNNTSLNSSNSFDSHQIEPSQMFYNRNQPVFSTATTTTFNTTTSAQTQAQNSNQNLNPRFFHQLTKSGLG